MLRSREQLIQNLLRRQRNITPKRIELSIEDNLVERLDHINFLCRRMTASIFVYYHLTRVRLHMEVTAINDELWLLNVE